MSKIDNIAAILNKSEFIPWKKFIYLFIFRKKEPLGSQSLTENIIAQFCKFVDPKKKE